MKLIILMLAAGLVATAAVQAQPGKGKQVLPAKKMILKNLKDSASYALGFNVGQNLAQRYGDMDVNIMIAAMKEAYAEKPCAIDVNTGPMIVNNYIMEATQKKAAESKVTGQKFLQGNAQKPGVTVTASGLQYEVLRQGSGERPTASDRVRVHYSGVLLNGKEFDNSYKRGSPAEFSVGGVIAGWTEALQLMNAGSKYKLYIPSSLAYGDSQMGTEIPPGSTLIFEVELLEVLRNPPSEAPQSNNGQ